MSEINVFLHAIHLIGSERDIQSVIQNAGSIDCMHINMVCDSDEIYFKTLHTPALLAIEKFVKLYPSVFFTISIKSQDAQFLALQHYKFGVLISNTSVDLGDLGGCALDDESTWATWANLLENVNDNLVGYSDFHNELVYCDLVDKPKLPVKIEKQGEIIKTEKTAILSKKTTFLIFLTTFLIFFLFITFLCLFGLYLWGGS